MSQAKNKAVLNVTIVGKYLSITKTRQDTISQNQVRLYAKKSNSLLVEKQSARITRSRRILNKLKLSN